MEPDNDEDDATSTSKRLSTDEVDAIIERHSSRLQSKYANAFPVIDWSDKSVQRFFAVRDGLIDHSKNLFGRTLSKALLAMHLSAHIHDGRDWRHCDYNWMLQEALDRDIITEEEFQSSFAGKFTTIKAYLWSVVPNKAVTSFLRNYACVCSQLMLRGSVFANLVATFAASHHRTDELFSVIKSKAKTRQLLLPEFFTSASDTSKLVKEAFLVFKDELPPCPDYLGVMSRSGWDNGLKFIASKYQSAIVRHVTVHLERRIRRLLETECTDPSASKEMFFQGTVDAEMTLDDRKKVDDLRKEFKLRRGEKWSAPMSLTKSVWSLHIRLMGYGSKGLTGSLVPFSSWSRSYHRCDSRVFDNLMKQSKLNVRFDDFFDPGVVTTQLRATRKRRRHAKRKSLKGKGRRKQYCRINSNVFKFKKGARISSIETDGCGLSMLISTPMEIRDCSIITKPSKKTWSQKTSEFFGSLQKDADSFCVAAVDLGRRQPAVIAFKPPKDSKKIPLFRITKADYLRRSKANIRREFYKREDNIPEARVALSAISNCKKKTANSDDVVMYARVLKAHWRAVENQFIQNDRRCLQAMANFRNKRSAIHYMANGVLQHLRRHHISRNVPLILATGDGSFGGGCVKGEQGGNVPVKEFRKHLGLLFARSRQRGHFWGNIDEFRTTKMCCKHHVVTVDHHCKRHGHRIWKTNNNVRRCAACANDKNVLGLIDRDINGATNILLVVEWLLKDGSRPEFLQRETRTIGRKRKKS